MNLVDGKTIEYTNRIERTVILTDGERLSELLIDYNVRVSMVESYAICKNR